MGVFTAWTFALLPIKGPFIERAGDCIQFIQPLPTDGVTQSPRFKPAFPRTSHPEMAHHGFQVAGDGF